MDKGWKLLSRNSPLETAPGLQVEWYVAGFLKDMGFQIWQAHPTTLQEAMDTAQNYKNSSQSLRKSLKRNEKRGIKQYCKDRNRRKHSETDDSSSSSELDSATSNSKSLKSDLGTGSKHRNQGRGYFQDRKGKGIVKVKIDKDDSKKMMKRI